MIDGGRSCTDPHVIAAFAYVQGSPALMNDFERASNFVATMIARTRDNPREIMAAGRGGERGGRGGPGGRGGRSGRGGRAGQDQRYRRRAYPDAPTEDNHRIDISARFYNDDEWATLSANQRNYVLFLRFQEQEGEQPPNQDGHDQQQRSRQQQQDLYQQQYFPNAPRNAQQPVQQQQNDQRNVQQQGRSVQFVDQQGPAQRQRTGEFQIQIADPSGNQVHVASISVAVPEDNTQQQQPSANDNNTGRRRPGRS